MWADASPLTKTNAGTVPKYFRRVLEFDPLRDVLCGYAHSDHGHSRVAALALRPTVVWITTQQQFSGIREFRRGAGNFNFAGLANVAG